MKKLRVILFALIGFVACTPSNKSVIQGEVKNFGSGEIYFIRSGDDEKIDTIKVDKDKFTFTTEVKEPTIYMVNFGASQQPGFFVIEQGKTSFTYEMNKAGSLDVKGGKEQALYTEFLNESKPIFQQMDSLGQVATAHEDDEALLGQLQQAFFRLDASLKQKQLKFIQAHKSNYVTAFIGINYLNEKMDKTLADAEQIYAGLEKTIQDSYYGKKLAEMITQMKNTAVGAQATDFTLPDINGKSVSLSSYKGKVTLIDFWASWCGPCRQENPNVVKAYEQYHGKGFEILGVSLDTQKPQWEAAIQKDHLSWTHVSDLKGWTSEVAATYGVQSIPTNFLLNAEGKIIARDLRGEDLKAKLAELFK